MVDEALSHAVVVYIWGDPAGRAWPGSDPDAVGRLFGERAPDLLARIRELFAEVDHFFDDPGDLAAISVKIQDTLRSNRPELSAEAARAIAASCTYNWK
ncbi:hypothetical protein AB0M43_09475 [Longispora sp. NPDC051575]|uniref:hypothetical protein n=1 Tax=Longispora sp. NPDC051575 TaxID=3154943 RepID=UPI003434451D